MKKARSIILIGFILSASGCAGSSLHTASIQPPAITNNLPGIYHRVEQGQTLWRISKAYGVEIEEIIRLNHIPNAGKIEKNQLIFIPKRQKQQVIKRDFSADDFIWPIKGKVISSFGQTFSNMLNKGLNIQPYSDHNVIAADSGKVVFLADDLNGFGKTIIIDHNNGFFTVYARNAQVYIKTGEAVRKGALIAKAGSTKEDPKTYLHFEVRKGHTPQNPYYYLP
jgi:murein DD-endopeptidase MepM/ murein hydrolase activator NlpD